MNRFAGKTVLVTGGSRGLGRAIALSFAAAGAFVAVGYHRRSEEAERVVDALREAGGSGSCAPIDVANATVVRAAVEAIVAEHGRLDVAVANAAIAEDTYFVLQDPDSFERVVATNLTGMANVCRAAARVMLPRRQGAIVTIASIAGMIAAPGQSSYAASKGGAIALTATIGAELAPKGVRVNCVAPGLLSTGLAARLDHRVTERRKSLIPLGRLGEADEVARVVLFLASNDSSYIVGQTIVVDGGMTA